MCRRHDLHDLSWNAAHATSIGGNPACGAVRIRRESVRENQIPEFIRDCSKLHVKYTNIMPNKSDKYSGQGRSWCSTLAVKDKQSAENKLRNLGYKWEWQSDYSIKVQTRPLPAIKTTKNGRKVFFNQMIAAFHHSRA